MLNLLIIGHGRHGKDTLAEIFAEHYRMTFKASSMAASEIFIYVRGNVHVYFYILNSIVKNIRQEQKYSYIIQKC